jgi:regulator of protease activity HflC (stomatin/prohibitin superfamily)
VLDWLTDILRWIGKIVPRLIIVPTTHCSVKFVRGKHAKLMTPGLWWVWPVTTSWVNYPTVRQSVNLNTQTLVTKDGQTVAISGIVVYSVDRPLDLLAYSYDADETIKDVSMAAVKACVVRSTMEDMRNRRMDGRLTRRIAKDLEPFGVKVIRAQMTDLAPCVAIRMINDAFSVMVQSGGGA